MASTSASDKLSRRRCVKKNAKYFSDQFVNSSETLIRTNDNSSAPEQIKTVEIKSDIKSRGNKRKSDGRRKTTNKRQKQEENRGKQDDKRQKQEDGREKQEDNREISVQHKVTETSNKDGDVAVKKDKVNDVAKQNSVEEKDLADFGHDNGQKSDVKVKDRNKEISMSGNNVSNLETIESNKGDNTHIKTNDPDNTEENNLDDKNSRDNKRTFAANLDLMSTSSNTPLLPERKSKMKDAEFSERALNMVEDTWGTSNPFDELTVGFCIFCKTKLDQAYYKQHIIEEQNKLLVHETQKGKSMFRCCEDGCEVMSSSRKELNLHVSKCQPCSEIDNQLKNLSNKRYKCRECGYSCSARSTLLQHTVKHTGERPFQCSKCLLRWKFIAQCLAHERTHKGEKIFKCTKCDKAFYTRDELEVHTSEHTGILPFQCSICKKGFSLKKRAARHYKTIHDTSQVYDCKDCDLTFNNYNEFMKHKNSHNGKLKCEMCNAVFSSKGTLRRHETTIHQTDNKQRYSCKVCFLNFTQRASLLRHERIYAKRSLKEHIASGKMVKNLEKRSINIKTKPLFSQLQTIPKLFPYQRTNFQPITKKIINVMEPNLNTVCLSLQGPANDDVENVMIKIGKKSEDGLQYVFLVFPDNTSMDIQHLFTDMLEKQPELLQMLETPTTFNQDSESYATILIKRPPKPDNEKAKGDHEPVDQIMPHAETKGNTIELCGENGNVKGALVNKLISQIDTRGSLEQSVSELSGDSTQHIVAQSTIVAQSEAAAQHALPQYTAAAQHVVTQYTAAPQSEVAAQHAVTQYTAAAHSEAASEQLQRDFQEKYANLISVMDSSGFLE